MHRLISLLLEAEATEEECTAFHSSIRVIDAFLVPKFRYIPSGRKHFFQYVNCFILLSLFLLETVIFDLNFETCLVVYRNADSLPIHGEATSKPLLIEVSLAVPEGLSGSTFY